MGEEEVTKPNPARMTERQQMSLLRKMQEQEQAKATTSSSSTSSSTSSATASSTTKCCEKNHLLKTFNTDMPGYKCDYCTTVQASDSTIHGCDECNYHLCNSCLVFKDKEKAKSEKRRKKKEKKKKKKKS